LKRGLCGLLPERLGKQTTGPRSIHHSAFPAARIAAQRETTVSLCLPARNEATTIGPIVRCLLPLLERGAVDQLVVFDDSTDGTAEIARGLGAEVYSQSDVHAEFGSVAGKGDALWRSLSVLRGEVVCFLDADSERFGEHFACGLVGALTCESGVAFAKGYYRRPFRVDVGVEMPDGGGRVTELMARPLLSFFYPELAAFRQPLAGEIAARRELLLSLPFVADYGVDIALLIDAWRREGLDRLVQVNLEVRQNRHQRLSDLVPMAESVLGAVLSRAVRDGRLALATDDRFLLPFLGAEASPSVKIEERPPLAALSRGAPLEAAGG
jgi:glucosyl-3-phosphoglycerate synthase